MVLIIAGFTLIALIDLIPLLRKRSPRGVFVFLALFILGLSLAVLQTASVKLPSIMLTLETCIRTLGLGY
ncbi:MAG TPA: hypothetical protein VN512_06570 [Clostridia bacterium]|nr:hypothetical protein [Clostridia bacterium]